MTGDTERTGTTDGIGVLIVGAAGMIGRKLAAKLATGPMVGNRPVRALHLHDVVTPVAPPGAAFDVATSTGDLSDPAIAASLAGTRPDIVVHLAAVVSGEAEANFDLGYRVNLDGTRTLFEAIRSIGSGYRPRVVFTSSLAVFGPPFPELVDDEFHLTPATCYGTQKAIGELLLSDYSRRGFLDGVGVRLPTICIRPGAPNRAASGFISGIVREPLAGQEAVLPVPDDLRYWIASPRMAIAQLLHAMALDSAPLGLERTLSMPGLSVTAAEQIEALRSVAGDAAVARIRRVADPAVERIVGSWPGAFTAARARALGFPGDADFAAILRAHIADELGG